MKKMCIILVCSLSLQGNSQLILSGSSPMLLLDFSAAMSQSAGTLPATVFSSAGFEPDPIIAGRLNSNAWSFWGWSDGSLLFGGSRIAVSTDYTRGSTSNAVSTGGIYSFTGFPASVSNPILVLQPGGADWAPGTMTLKIKNGGAVMIQSLTIQYDLYVRNDQSRSSSFLFSHGTNDINYSAAPSLNYFSPAAADAAGLVHIGGAPSRDLTISGLAIAPGAYYYLRWSSEDVSGSGSRDEFGIDNIMISAGFAQAPLPVSLIDFRAQIVTENNLISWKTVFEQNNRGFELQRSENGINFQTLEFINSRAYMGNSHDEINYSFIDKQAEGRSWYYRLRQLDDDGRTSFSPVVVCQRKNVFSVHVYGPFPNPVINEFELEINTYRSGVFFITVVDMAGHSIVEKNLTLRAGKNKVKISSVSWSKGQYQICVVSAEGSCREKKLLIKL